MQNKQEELANSITHGLGLLLCLVALPILLQDVAEVGGAGNVFSVAVYAFSLLLVYASSTLYHSISHPMTKKWLRRIDHIGIYFLIAGTYTPFLVMLIKTNSSAMLIFIWTVVALGIFLKLFVNLEKQEIFSLASYLILGWLGIFYVTDLWTSLPGWSFAFLVIGGLCYSIGVIFYVWEKLKFNHAIWHLFVIAGSALHFASIHWAVNYPLK